MERRSVVLLAASAAIIFSSTICSQGQTCYQLGPGGLVGWWRGEGDATDSAGAWTGTLVNDVDFAPAKVGLGFDVRGGDGYVALPPNLFPYPSSGNSGNAPFSFEVGLAPSRAG